MMKRNEYNVWLSPRSITYTNSQFKGVSQPLEVIFSGFLSTDKVYFGLKKGLVIETNIN